VRVATSTTSSPQLTDPLLEREPPQVSHIVGPDYDDDGNKIQGAAKVTQAIINGTPVTALCGYTWVPSRDPKKLPICEACKAIVGRTGDGS
jgi:hypothetical protein